MKGQPDLVNQQPEPTTLVAIAEVARPHGVQGELRLKVFNRESTAIAKGRHLFLRLGRAPERRVLVSAVRPTEGALLVRLEGVHTRDDAEAVRGAVLLVARGDLPEPEGAEFYACDVEGARAELVTGDVVGTVRQLASYPTCDVLVVDLADGTSVEVPLTDAFVAEVDVTARVVRLTTLEGLTG